MSNAKAFKLDPNTIDRTPPQTEDSEERGFVKKRDDRNLGKSQELNNESGDIADETPGRRG